MTHRETNRSLYFVPFLLHVEENDQCSQTRFLHSFGKQRATSQSQSKTETVFAWLVLCDNVQGVNGIIIGYTA